jgi:hypothetical protein
MAIFSFTVLAEEQNFTTQKTKTKMWMKQHIQCKHMHTNHSDATHLQSAYFLMQESMERQGIFFINFGCYGMF